MRYQVNQRTIQYLFKQTDLLIKYMEQVYRDAKMDNIHKLRVTTRRIRSILQLTHIKGLRLNKIAKELGKIRDLDVAIKNCKRYKLKEESLLKERKRLARDLHSQLHSKKRRKIENKICTLKKKLESSSTQLDIHSSTKKLYDQLNDEFNFEDPKELHRLRITLKKTRYLFEAIDLPTLALKKVQDQLGEIHDLEILKGHFPQQSKIILEKNNKIKNIKERLSVVLKQSLEHLKGL